MSSIYSIFIYSWTSRENKCSGNIENSVTRRYKNTFESFAVYKSFCYTVISVFFIRYFFLSLSLLRYFNRISHCITLRQKRQPILFRLFVYYSWGWLSHLSSCFQLNDMAQWKAFFVIFSVQLLVHYSQGKFHLFQERSHALDNDISNTSKHIFSTKTLTHPCRSRLFRKISFLAKNLAGEWVEDTKLAFRSFSEFMLN